MNTFRHPDSFAVAYAGVPVNVLEVRLIAGLKAAGKQFEYKIYEDGPGGHHFNGIKSAARPPIAPGSLRVPREVPEALAPLILQVFGEPLLQLAVVVAAVLCV